MHSSSVSRRRFLQAAGATTVWVPASVKGYIVAEAAANSAAQGQVGISKWDLDTPALCVDLEALAANLATMQRTMAANGIASRPHAKTHKCPAIAKRQLAGGSVGICTAKVGEAEACSSTGSTGS